MHRLAARKSLIIVVTILFVANLLCAFHHLGSLTNDRGDRGGTSSAFASIGKSHVEHSSGCRICQWMCAGKTAVPRPILLDDSSLLIGTAPACRRVPIAALPASRAHSRAPPARLA
ncbi:MAG: hypothetical protein HYR85_24480 [Planctomycetes bacterium]|nr:hypothetical protein [Planctomycetota bacterium]MBI3845764.1 hypothetical protein [Planctomycetota bacterium]